MPTLSPLSKKKITPPKDNFRIAIFGSSRIKKDDNIYNQVFSLAEKIGNHDFDLVTGGGAGLMEAASAGHFKGSKDISTQTIGLTVKLPYEKEPNKYLEIKKHFDRFSERLDTFMTLSNVVVVYPGGIGTCLEFFYAWQLTQVKHICNNPIILVGEMWPELMEWITKWQLDKGLISTNDLKNIHLAKNNDEAMEIIIKVHELYEKLGDSFCLNWKKYKLTQ